MLQMIINYQPSLSLYDLDSFVLAIGPWDGTATQVLEGWIAVACTTRATSQETQMLQYHGHNDII